VSLDAGKVDIVSGNLRRSDEREANYIHTYRAYNYTPYVITVLDGVNDIQSIDDLAGKKVGIGQGSLQATILEHYIEETGLKIDVVYTKDMPNDLIAKRIDAGIGPLFSIESYNSSFENVKFKSVGSPVVSKEGNGSDNNAYFWLGKGNEELRDAVSEAIYKLRKEGKLSELITQFYSTDHTQSIDESKEEEQIKALGK
jgi:L-cystine transport system substrate-binding protein